MALDYAELFHRVRHWFLCCVRHLWSFPQQAVEVGSLLIEASEMGHFMDPIIIDVWHSEPCLLDGVGWEEVAFICLQRGQY